MGRLAFVARYAILRGRFRVLENLKAQLRTVLSMQLRNVLLVSAAASLGEAAPAAACDRHGPGQMGGFHRYNPIEDAFNNEQSRADQFANSEVVARRDKSEKRKAEDKKREEALDADATKAEKKTAALRERRQQGRGALK